MIEALTNGNETYLAEFLSSNGSGPKLVLFFQNSPLLPLRRVVDMFLD